MKIISNETLFIVYKKVVLNEVITVFTSPSYETALAKYEALKQQNPKSKFKLVRKEMQESVISETEVPEQMELSLVG